MDKSEIVNYITYFTIAATFLGYKTMVGIREVNDEIKLKKRKEYVKRQVIANLIEKQDEFEANFPESLQKDPSKRRFHKLNNLRPDLEQMTSILSDEKREEINKIYNASRN